MFRLIWLTFFGKKRYDEHHVHVHESPKNMTVPLMILAFLSLTGGWFAFPALWGGKDYFTEFLSPVFGSGEIAGGESLHSLELTLSGVAVGAATLGLLVAWRMYAKDVKRGTSTGLHKLLYNKYYIDELYQAAIVGPLVWISRNILWKAIDEGTIDGAVNGIGYGVREIGDGVRHVQSGNTRSYAVWVLVGAIVVFRRHLLADCASRALWRNTLMALSGNLLTVLVFFPLVGVLAVLLLRKEDHLWIRRISLIVGIVEFLLSFLPVWAVTPGTTGYKLEVFHQWITTPAINYHLGVDGISIFLVHLITLLTPIGILASWNDIKHRVKEFHIMLLLLEIGVIGIFLSLDLFLFFLFWEFGLIPLAFLIGIWGHERRIYAAIKFILYTMGGSIFMLVGMIWLYNKTGTFDLPALQAMVHSGALLLTPGTEMLLFLSFFIAFAIKVPLFPFHTWLPDAHTEAPTAGSVDLAGVLLKTGAYGIIRVCLPLFPDAARRAAPYIAVLAIISIIYGALVALVQPNLKRLVAYSSVSHMGFVVLGIFAFTNVALQGAVFLMLAHGISTGALFLLVGMLYERRHTFEISEFGGLGNADATICGFLSVRRTLFAGTADAQRVCR